MNEIYKMDEANIALRMTENTIKQTDSYAIKNRGFVTASKLKVFRASPENYFLKYVMEEPGKTEEKKCFTIGTAVDDYISYWEDKFYEKYFVPEGKMLKPDWVALCEKLELDSTGTVDVLKARATAGKIVLTDTDAKNVLGMIAEYKRQPIFNYDGWYETQKEFEFEYKGLKLKATLDRFLKDVVWSEKWEIRDMKTTSKIEKFNFSAIDFGYDFSMSFYNILGALIYEKNFELILDVVSSSFPYASQSIKMPAETVVQQGQTAIIPTLNKLAAMTEEWLKTKDPKVWLGNIKDLQEPHRENLFSCEMYGEMDTTIQKEFTFLQ